MQRVSLPALFSTVPAFSFPLPPSSALISFSAFPIFPSAAASPLPSSCFQLRFSSLLLFSPSPCSRFSKPYSSRKAGGLSPRITLFYEADVSISLPVHSYSHLDFALALIN